jgi:basic amino acid/polyamine antiporter, APA family
MEMRLAKSPTVFLREATGLVRDIGPFDATILSIAGIIGPTWIPVFVGEWSLYPGVSVPASFLILAVLGSLWGLFYVMISSLFSRSGGGGYVPLSRTIHPALGMAMSFLVVVAFVLNLGFIASIILPVAVSGPLLTFATLTSNTALVGIATTLATRTSTIVSGTVALILVALVAIGGTRFILRINRIAFVLGTLGFVVIIVVLLSTTQSQFQAAFDAYAGSPTAYQAVITAAHSSGYNPPSDWVYPTLLSLPLSFFTITGFQTSTYFSGEIRKVSKSMIIAVIGSILYGGLLFSLVATLLQRQLGSDFVTSSAYDFNVAGNWTLKVPAYANTFVTIVNHNPIVSGILILSIISFSYLLMMNFFYIGTRHFLAWSFDRTFPARLGSVSDRTHSPVWAVVVLALVAWFAFLVYSLSPATTGPINLTFIFIAAWMLDGLAGIALPFARKHLYESAPPLVKKKVGGIPLIAIMGAYAVILLVVLFIAALSNPIAIGEFSEITAGTIITGLVLGLAFYFGSKAYHARSGLDISLSFKELPPE